MNPRSDLPREVDELDAALYHLVLEIRFVADLLFMLPPQPLQLDGEKLAVTLTGFADRLEVVAGMIPAAAQATRCESEECACERRR